MRSKVSRGYTWAKSDVSVLRNTFLVTWPSSRQISSAVSTALRVQGLIFGRKVAGGAVLVQIGIWHMSAKSPTVPCATGEPYGARAMMYRKSALRRTVPSAFTYGRRAASWARVTASSLVRSAADLAEPAEFKPRTAIARVG